MIEKFISKSLKQQLEEYENKLEEFTKTVTLSLLEEVKPFLDQLNSADMPQVVFKLTGFWPSVTIKRFQRFVDHVFEDNSSALTNIRVKQGCICVTWYTRKSMIASLTARAQEKVLFMRHVGVMSLRVGDTVILERQEETETDLNTALIQAITADCTEAVEFLLFLGADPTTTPLMLACANNSFSIAKLLLDAGADVNAEVTDKWNRTALKVVCSLAAPIIDLVELLVESGAQLVIPGERITALAIATLHRHINTVQYLVSAGALVDAPNEDGVTSLMYACRNNHFEIAHFLLTHGADPNIQDQNNSTALHSACYSQMTSGVELLLALGADLNLRGMREATPLIFACVKDRDDCTMDPSILVLLLSAGADPSAKNDEGSTALITASYFNYKEGVSVLLNAGANVNIQNIFGETALHGAAKNGYLVISELLLEFGAQLSLSDIHGMTPLDYALDNNHHDVCQLLLANIDSNPLPAVTESTGTSPLPTRQEPIPPLVRWLSKKIRTNWIKAPNFQDIIFRHFDMI